MYGSVFNTCFNFLNIFNYCFWRLLPIRVFLKPRHPIPIPPLILKNIISSKVSLLSGQNFKIVSHFFDFSMSTQYYTKCFERIKWNNYTTESSVDNHISQEHPTKNILQCSLKLEKVTQCQSNYKEFSKDNRKVLIEKIPSWPRQGQHTGVGVQIMVVCACRRYVRNPQPKPWTVQIKSCLTWQLSILNDRKCLTRNYLFKCDFANLLSQLQLTCPSIIYEPQNVVY